MNRITFPLNSQVHSQAVADLQNGLGLVLDRNVLHLSASEQAAFKARLGIERAQNLYGTATQALVRLFQSQHHLPDDGEVDEASANALNAVLEQLGAFGQLTAGGPFLVDGTVTSRSRAGVGGLRVTIVDRRLGADDLAVTETTTDGRGGYRSSFAIPDLAQRGKTAPDLQARVFAGKRFLGASDVRYDASTHETLDVRLDNAADSHLASEFETLTGDLAAHFQGRLGDLKETGQKQDITYLANKSGWDARAVALAALADQFSTRTAGTGGTPAIPQSFFYALFRAGLPAKEETLYYTDDRTLEAVWRQAVAQGVIPASSTNGISDAIAEFRSRRARKLLDGPPVAGVSRFSELLAASGLDQTQHERFASLYATHHSDTAALWDATTAALGAETTARLRADGKIALLTINNAPLMRKVRAAVANGGTADPLKLAQSGYHRASAWTPLLTADIAVPKEIPGDSVESKRSNYASYLAAQIRLTHPTASVAHLVKSGDVPVTAGVAGLADEVHAFLTEHEGKFEIGAHPVDRYLAQNHVHLKAETVREVKRLQRVYQITPSDEAMAGLIKRGIDASYHVVRYEREAFVESFQDDVGGADAAALIYDRAAQVHNAVLNVALSYVNARTAPAVGVHSPASVVNPTPAQADDVVAFASLGQLFGSMDFCACDHCRSILSPAAYLVDLLHFIDCPGKGVNNPQTILLNRRPDLAHLPLTCQNTNTVLPYIDVVNEALEYFVGNGKHKHSLTDYHGHDTRGAESDDLLATPQADAAYEAVRESAYTTLREQHFPAPLPFTLSLETLRRYFATCNVPLPLAMERLRKTDDMERGANPYGWRDILMEGLGLARAEHDILTAGEPLWKMYGFPDDTADAVVIAEISNAKRFAHRLDITYDDLVSILSTQFVNPNLALLPKLERLRVSFATLAALKQGLTPDAFKALLPKGAGAPDPKEYGGDIAKWVVDVKNFPRIMGLLTLAVPADVWKPLHVYVAGDCVRPIGVNTESGLYYECRKAGMSAAAEPKWTAIAGETTKDGPAVEWVCRDVASAVSFTNVAFRYADPTKVLQNVSAVEFVRLLRFIRLWKKLGWTIDQTDAAICALYRADLGQLDAGQLDDVDEVSAGFSTLLPRLGIVTRVMTALNLTVKRDLQSVLACWSDLPSRRPDALYRRLFLNPAIVQQDSVFADNSYGEFLVDTNQTIGGHAAAIRSALTLTADEYDTILAALTYSSSTPLTLAAVSAIYRRGWLARKMKISVRELRSLISATGLDPFTSPDLTVLRFIALVQALQARSLKTTTALSLVWNRHLSGNPGPDADHAAVLMRALRAGLAAVETEFALADDADGTIAQSRLSLVYGADVATFFFGLLTGTFLTEVAFGDPDGTFAKQRDSIEEASGKTEAGLPGVVYDDFRKRLSFGGRLTAAARDAVQAAAGASAQKFNDAVDELYEKHSAQVDPFFAKFPELKGPFEQYIGDSKHSPGVKRSGLLKALLPDLVRRRKRQQARTVVSATAGVDAAFADALLGASAAPYPLHAAGDVTRSALDDLMSVESAGLSMQLLDSGAAKWGGFLEAPDTGFFNLRVEADSGATVTVALNGKVIAPAGATSPWSNQDPIPLETGALVSISITVDKANNPVIVKWDWNVNTQGPTKVPSRYLYAASAVAVATASYRRFLKATSLATALRLTAGEIAFLATHPECQVSTDGWLNALPVDGDPVIAVKPELLLQPFEHTLAFSRIKSEISPDDESLVSALKDMQAATAKTDSLLFRITSWNRQCFIDVAAHLSSVAEPLARFERVYDAFQVIQPMGVAAGVLIDAATNAPSDKAAHDLEAALHARYDHASWRDLVRPINDELRALRRDALVAYVLHQMRSHPKSAHIDSPDKLFEYFLMDVQMEPCMQTSRIRHAIASVQLFIERCLMQLESDVSPTVINAKRWAWMKRYRVWEANRKVFLYPENWLEPELRDDKSPFYREFESELLQSDITEDSAATALVNYLSKLEEVAKLEPCAIHYIPGDSAKDSAEVAHVVARTAGAHRKYFHRRYDRGRWTPWESIKLDIEDNPVLPVVWNDRLFLFWLRILKSAPATADQGLFKTPADKTPTDKTPTDKTLGSVEVSQLAATSPDITVSAVLCWSEHYNGKWQPTRTSDVDRAISLGTFAPGHQRDRSTLVLGASEEADVATGAHTLLRVWIEPYDWFYRLYNTHSLPEASLEEAKSPASSFMAELSHVHDRKLQPPSEKNPAFSIKYSSWTSVVIDPGSPGDDTYGDDGASVSPASSSVPVLKTAAGARTVETQFPLPRIWDAPFFLEDARHVFYVRTEPKPQPMSHAFGYPFITTVYGAPPDLAAVVMPGSPKPQPSKKRVNEPSSMRQFVSEDAYIHRGLGLPGAVGYQGTRIGPSGAMAALASGE